jgi:hypothetical protein
MNSAIAGSRIRRMAEAMNYAVKASSCVHRRIQRQLYASASSPLDGLSANWCVPISLFKIFTVGWMNRQIDIQPDYFARIDQAHQSRESLSECICRISLHDYFSKGQVPNAAPAVAR